MEEVMELENQVAKLRKERDEKKQSELISYFLNVLGFNILKNFNFLFKKWVGKLKNSILGAKALKMDFELVFCYFLF